MRYGLPLALLLLGACSVHVTRMPATDPADERAVIAALEQLIDAINSGDSASLRAVLHPEARLATIGDRNGVSDLRIISIDGFLDSVGAPRNMVWEERISAPEVRIDGDLATAWMNYAFHIDGRFSHCGVNAIQFFRATTRWQVVQITDTRRTDDCRPVQD